MRSPTRAFAAAAVLLLAAAAGRPAPAAQGLLWLHVEIENAGGEDGGLHVPAGAVGALLRMAPDAVFEDGQFHVGAEYAPALRALRAVWRQLQAAGDGEPVTAQHEDALVRVARAGERLEVHVEYGGREAQGSVPAAVVEALLSGAGDTLHIDAGLAALQALPGEVVHVTEPDRRVRIWVDDSPGG